MERFLIEYCAETLAALKMANLFSYPYQTVERLNQEILKVNELIRETKITIECLKVGRKRALIYVYRKEWVQKTLKEMRVSQFLSYFGYQVFTIDDCITYLKERLNSCTDFPHEIGIFLDYPIEDVIGFIEHQGKDYKGKGYWKVYDHVAETLQRFEQFTSCREFYLHQYKEGLSLQDLIL